MVDRYKVVVGNVTATAHGAAHPDGEYVLWRDYEALRAEVERLRSQFANSEREVARLRADAERVAYCERYALAMDFDYAGNGDCVMVIELPRTGRYPAHFREAIDEAIRLSPPTSAGPSV